jgi:protein gp37
MHDIWNPWHGCRKVSEGCEHCYMFYLDRLRDQDGSRITRTAAIDAPLRKDRRGAYKIASGEHIRVCMTSDFFLEEADPWRQPVWDIIRRRSDVVFFLLTKRPQRAAQCLPDDWGQGWDNVFFNVTAENQRRADERIPLLLKLPFRHKGVMCAPLIGAVDLDRYLDSGQIEQVLCGGENYDGCRICRYEWVRALSQQCRRHDVTFDFIETGTRFEKDGVVYPIPDKTTQSRQAFRSGLSYQGPKPVFRLTDPFGNPLPPQELYVPRYRPDRCTECGRRMTCNGCRFCGACDQKKPR